jgi:hypothetical protein
MDQEKTEVAWFFASERSGVPSIAKAKKWRLDWDGISRKFDHKAKPVRWLGFFLDCRMNWRAHVKHRLALGRHRLRTMGRIMTTNDICKKLARKVGWAIAMSTAAYGIEAIWEGQAWLLEGFDKLTTAIGRTVAATFGTTKGEDAVRAADTPPAGPALDRRRELPDACAIDLRAQSIHDFPGGVGEFQLGHGVREFLPDDLRGPISF